MGKKSAVLGFLLAVILLVVLFFAGVNISGRVVSEKENFMLDFIRGDYKSSYENPSEKYDSFLGQEIPTSYHMDNLFEKESVASASFREDIRPEYSGFIIEFEKEPFVKKKVELEKTAIENQQIIDDSPRYSYTRIQKSSEVNIGNLDSYIQKHKQEINSERNQIKKEISYLVSDKKDVSITGKIISFFIGKSISEPQNETDKLTINEFENLFNGIVINVSEETAREISKIKGVKRVWPNMRVEALLEDSVPLIQEGVLAGRLDEDGNNCLSSGKECLTGEGIKIAIIDTGVDYTHPDLGGSSSNYIFSYHPNFPRIRDNKIVWHDNRDGDNEIYMYNLDLQKEFKITDDSSDEVHPDICGNYIVWTDYTNNGIYLYNILDKSVKRINNRYSSIARIYENKVVWSDARDGNYNIYLYDILNEQETQLTNNPKDEWAPEIYNNSIIWFDNRNVASGSSTADIYMKDLSTGIEKRITTEPNAQNNGRSYWIYGDNIIWQKFNGGIFIYNIVTSEIKQLSDDGFIRDPSVYDNKVLWSEIKDDVFKIFVYDLTTDKISILRDKSSHLSYSMLFLNKLIYIDDSTRNIEPYKNEQLFLFDLVSQEEKQITGFDITSNIYYPNSKVIGGYDFVNNDNDPIDDNGHGTHVAATAAGNGSLKGVAPDAQILGYKVLDAGGSGNWNNIIAAIEKAVEDGADILSLSLGRRGGNPDDPVSTAVDNAVLNGTVVVVAAGNSGPSEQTIGSPATSRKAITVGSTTKQDAISSFSSRGPVVWKDSEGNEKTIIKPDIVATGGTIGGSEFCEQGLMSENRICAAWLDHNYLAISGTSMATPHISGAVALLKQKHPDWTPEQIKVSLKATAINLGYSVTEQGAGRVNVSKLVALNEPLEMPFDFYIYPENFMNNIYDTVVIKGIFPEDYDSLFVEWKKEDELIWRTEGVNIIGVGEIVAEFKSEDRIFESGNYKFGAGVVKKGIEKKSETSIYFDKDLMKGWSYSLSEDQGIGTLAISDIDNNGEQEIILHTLTRDYVFNSNGTLRAGWPTEYRTPAYWTNAQISPAAIGDIDNDGFKEIVVAIRDYYLYKGIPLDYSYCFIVYDFEGNHKEGWPRGCNEDINVRSDGAHYVAPIISDLNNDGNLKIIGVSESYQGRPTKIHVFNSDGSYFESWPYELPEDYTLESHNAVSVGDVNNNGGKEIVAIIRRDNKRFLFIWDYSGSLLESYPIELPLSYRSMGGVILADINNDGFKEIGLMDSYGNCYSNNGKLLYLNLDGSIVENWPVNFNDQFLSRALSVGDLNNDGNIETVFGTTGACSDDYDYYSVYIINNQGLVLEGWPKVLEKGEGVITQAVIGDITGDMNSEVLVATTKNRIYAWDFQGNLISGFPKLMEGSYNSGIAVGDVTGNGKVNIVSASDKRIYLWEFDAPYNPDKMDWPQFQHDSQHTGCYDCVSSERFTTTLSFNPNWKIKTEDNISIILNNQLDEEKSVNYSLSYSKCDYADRYDCKYSKIHSGTKKLSSKESFTDKKGLSFSKEGEHVLKLEITGDENKDYYYKLNVIKFYSDLYAYISSDDFLIDTPSNITFYIYNEGNGKTENANYSLYYQKGSCYYWSDWNGCDNLKLIRQKNFELEKQDYLNEKVEFTFDEEGYYTLVLILNSENEIDEEEVSYNIVYVKQKGPDVYIERDWSSYLRDYIIGENSNITYIIGNIGTENAESVNAYFYLEGEDYDFILKDSKSIGSLDKEEIVYVNFSFTPNKKGYNYFLANVSATEDVKLENNQVFSYIRALNKGVDVGIDSVYLSSGQNNFINGNLKNYGTEATESVNVSYFIEDRLIESKEIFFSHFNFQVPAEFSGRNVKVKISAEIANDVDRSDNVFEKDFYIPKIENISLAVKDSKGNYAERFVFNLDGSIIQETKDGPVNLTLVENSETIILLYSKSKDFHEENFEGMVFQRFDYRPYEEIITERHDSIKEGENIYYFVNAFNTSFDYLGLEVYYQIERKELLSRKIKAVDLDALELVYCVNFSFEFQKCLSGWNSSERSYFYSSPKYLQFNMYSIDEKVGAVALTLSEKLQGTDERKIGEDIAANYKKWNKYGKIEFLEKVNISRIKQNKDLLNDISIKRNKISINTSSLVELGNISVKITFKNVDYVAPKIIQDGDDCKEYCSEIFYNKTENIVVVNVTGFSGYEVIEGPYCGDGICQSGESSQNCPHDCYVSEGSRGGGGDSLGGGGVSPIIKTCVQNWSCVFGPCIENETKEICIDLNNCGVLTGKPEERIQSCFVSVDNDSQYPQDNDEKDSDSIFWRVFFVVIFSLFILFLIVLIFALFLIKKISLRKKRIQTDERTEKKIRELLDTGRKFIKQERNDEALKVYEEIRKIYDEDNRKISKELYSEIIKFFQLISDNRK